MYATTFLPFASAEDPPARTPGVIYRPLVTYDLAQCTPLSRCWPLGVEVGFAITLVLTALCVARDFGWRAYRKFGADATGQKLKQIYRRRMICFALLHLDLIFALLLLLARSSNLILILMFGA